MEAEVVQRPEAEALVQSLQISSLRDVGSER